MSVSNKHLKPVPALSVPPRLLLGPGPSNADPRVLKAMSTPQLGHLDPAFVALMNENQEMLRYVWQTDNPVTIPVSGTGSAAMEATMANLVEPGDSVLMCANGYFALRLGDMASRYGGKVEYIKAPWGTVFTLAEIEAAIVKHKPAILGIVHAETSTGALQPMEGIGDLCRKHNCLLVLDTVTSIAGVPLFLDDWKVDAAYAGGQKCLNCPPGIAPVTFGPRAVAKFSNRKSPVANWYLDMTLVGKYWGSERTYHHTAPINMNYALREALRIVCEETLEARWKRQQEMSTLLWKSLEDIGLQLLVKPEVRLAPLTTVLVPEGIDAKKVIKYLMTNYNLEISGGLGELAGKVWRIGLMGYNARKENILLVCAALKKALKSPSCKSS